MDKARFDWIIKALDADLLNDWELQFLSDLEHKVNSGKELTERQEEILERIFEEKQ